MHIGENLACDIYHKWWVSPTPFPQRKKSGPKNAGIGEKLILGWPRNVLNIVWVWIDLSSPLRGRNVWLRMMQWWRSGYIWQSLLLYNAYTTDVHQQKQSDVTLGRRIGPSNPCCCLWLGTGGSGKTYQLHKRYPSNDYNASAQPSKSYIATTAPAQAAFGLESRLDRHSIRSQTQTGPSKLPSLWSTNCVYVYHSRYRPPGYRCSVLGISIHESWVIVISQYQQAGFCCRLIYLEGRAPLSKYV